MKSSKLLIEHDGYKIVKINIDINDSVNIKKFTIIDDIIVYLDGYFFLEDNNNLYLDNKKNVEKIYKLINTNKHREIATISGSFNIVYIDKTKEKIIIVTDKYALRPIYKYEKNSHIISLNFKDIVDNKNFDSSLDYNAISDFLMFNWVLNDCTFFKKIKRFPAATVSIYQPFKNIDIEYFKENEEYLDNSNSLDENAEKVHYLLKKAFHSSMLGIDKLGITISGGLDSRLNVGFAVTSGIYPILYNCKNNELDTLAAYKISQLYGLELIIEEAKDTFTNINNYDIELGDGCTSISQFWLTNLFKIINNHSKVDCIIDGFNYDNLLNPPNEFMCYESQFSIKKTVNKDDVVNIAKLTHGLHDSYIEKYFNSSALKKNIECYSIDRYLNECRHLINNVNSFRFIQLAYLKTRGRRYTFMMSMLNRNYFDNRFPGLDYNFIDYSLTLPKEQIVDSILYLKIYEKFYSDLSSIIWAHTGLPLSKGRIDKKNILENYIYYLVRLTKGRINWFSDLRDSNTRYRIDKMLRKKIFDNIIDGNCIKDGIIDKDSLLSLLHDVRIGKNLFTLIEKILTIEMFYKTFCNKY